jgi:hypothetical protein
VGQKRTVDDRSINGIEHLHLRQVSIGALLRGRIPVGFSDARPERPKRPESSPRAAEADVDLVAETEVLDRQGQLVAVPWLGPAPRTRRARRPPIRRRPLGPQRPLPGDPHAGSTTPIYKYWHGSSGEHFDRLPTTGGALIVANPRRRDPARRPRDHARDRDPAAPKVYGLAENLFRSVPVVGTLWARGGGVAAHPDNAYRLLHDEGQLVLVFPEGAKATGKRFTERYQLHRFGRGDSSRSPCARGVPVIPSQVVGAEEAMPIVFKSSRARSCSASRTFPSLANMLMMGPLGSSAISRRSSAAGSCRPCTSTSRPTRSATHAAA